MRVEIPHISPHGVLNALKNANPLAAARNLAAWDRHERCVFTKQIVVFAAIWAASPAALERGLGERERDGDNIDAQQIFIAAEQAADFVGTRERDNLLKLCALQLAVQIPQEIVKKIEHNLPISENHAILLFEQGQQKCDKLGFARLAKWQGMEVVRKLDLACEQSAQQSGARETTKPR